MLKVETRPYWLWRRFLWSERILLFLSDWLRTTSDYWD